MTTELDKKIARHFKRMQAFVDNGLPKDKAFDLAESMWNRDADPQDDRRVCFECEHHVSKHCTAITDKFNRPTTQPRFVLQRCDHFQLKGKKC
jgi:hypothetical protein